MKCPQQPNRARMADGGKGHRAEPKEEAPLADDFTTTQRFFVNRKKVQEFPPPKNAMSDSGQR
jgi:hypothetical protein